MQTWNWDIYDHNWLNRTIERCRAQRIILPTFKQLQQPQKIPRELQSRMPEIGLHDQDSMNLFRINWCNDPAKGDIGKINFVEIPQVISGVKARIIGLVGKHFPTGAHKVGATYGCLAPALVTGRFDPEFH